MDFADPFDVARERKAPEWVLKCGRAGVAGALSNSITMASILRFVAQRPFDDFRARPLPRMASLDGRSNLARPSFRGQVKRRTVL